VNCQQARNSGSQMTGFQRSARGRGPGRPDRAGAGSYVALASPSICLECSNAAVDSNPSPAGRAGRRCQQYSTSATILAFSAPWPTACSGTLAAPEPEAQAHARRPQQQVAQRDHGCKDLFSGASSVNFSSVSPLGEWSVKPCFEGAGCPKDAVIRIADWKSLLTALGYR